MVSRLTTAAVIDNPDRYGCGILFDTMVRDVVCLARTVQSVLHLLYESSCDLFANIVIIGL